MNYWNFSFLHRDGVIILSSTNQRLCENPLWTFRRDLREYLHPFRLYTRKTIDTEKVGRCLHISGTWWHQFASTAANCRPQMICLLHNSIVMHEWEQSLLCRRFFSSATVSIFFFVCCSETICGRVTPLEFTFYPYVNCEYILRIVDSMTIKLYFFPTISMAELLNYVS